MNVTSLWANAQFKCQPEHTLDNAMCAEPDATYYCQSLGEAHGFQLNLLSCKSVPYKNLPNLCEVQGLEIESEAVQLSRPT